MASVDHSYPVSLPQRAVLLARYQVSCGHSAGPKRVQIGWPGGMDGVLHLRPSESRRKVTLRLRSRLGDFTHVQAGSNRTCKGSL
jgi:hypothetical protein